MIKEPDAISYLCDLALDMKDFPWLKRLQSLREEVNNVTPVPVKIQEVLQKITLRINFVNYSIEDYRNMKEYLNGKFFEDKIRYLRSMFGDDIATALFIVEKVLK
jgi:hypothetical protein